MVKNKTVKLSYIWLSTVASDWHWPSLSPLLHRLQSSCPEEKPLTPRFLWCSHWASNSFTNSVCKHRPSFTHKNKSVKIGLRLVFLDLNEWHLASGLKALNCCRTSLYVTLESGAVSVNAQQWPAWNLDMCPDPAVCALMWPCVTSACSHFSTDRQRVSDYWTEELYPPPFDARCHTQAHILLLTHACHHTNHTQPRTCYVTTTLAGQRFSTWGSARSLNANMRVLQQYSWNQTQQLKAARWESSHWF